jgi:methyl-accepting chemotaxis protein
MARASRCVLGIVLSSIMALALASAGVARAEPPPAHESGRVFEVDANVGLSALATIADGHLQRMTDGLRVLALSEQARSAKWGEIERPLGEVGKLNVAALNWFALPDGSYWSVQNGREKGNLSTRAYFPRVLAGNVVVGELVVSKATAESVAVVAVPVTGRDGSVVGVLGASIYLKPLSARIHEEMRLGDDLIFYSFDATPRLAIVWDPSLVFTNPKDLGAEVDRAFTEMMTKDAGVVRYTFHEKGRTVVYRRSTVTGWWYGLGLVGPTMTATAWHDAGVLKH